jgi:hypothetical protein
MSECVLCKQPWWPFKKQPKPPAAGAAAPAAGGRRGQPIGFGPASYPQNRSLAPVPQSGGTVVSEKTAPHVMATTAVQIPNPMRGVGADPRNGIWEVPSPNWGSHGQLRFGQFVSSPTSSRVQVLDTLYDRGDLRPADQTPKPRLQNYPALRAPSYNVRAVTEKQYLALAKERAMAAARRSGR